MSEEMRMWVEIVFNLIYLVVVWGLVIAMIRKRTYVLPENRQAANLTIWAFGLLALGDTGHVGFRIIAYALGDLNANIRVLGIDLGLVGMGALATAITVTFFYALVLLLWRVRFNQMLGLFGYILLGVGLVRLVLMMLPQNDWNATIPPQPWSTIRNFPLTIQGLGVATLILRDSLHKQDRIFKWIGVMILVSFACYLPVILWVQQAPVIGMLMIPKTMAYVAIAFLAYFNMFNPKKERHELGLQSASA